MSIDAYESIEKYWKYFRISIEPRIIENVICPRYIDINWLSHHLQLAVFSRNFV